jgi:tripartite-type tricarboxylate transporter receptor subunit TctC
MLRIVAPVLRTLIFLTLGACSGAAFAQVYPIKPIRLVVPFVPGGGSDTLGRMIAQKLAQGLKQQAFVDNRGGAGGRLGTDLVAKAAPDGYTLLFTGSGTLIMAPALYEKLTYDPQRDFAPISLIASSAYVLLVHPSVPVRSLKQLIALCRTKPGLLNYASAGLGAPGHLSGELFQSMAGVKMTHVPYKGTAPGIMSVIAGETDLTFSSLVPAVPAIHSGRVRAVAVTSSGRSSILPEVPTMAESGLPGYETMTHYGLLAPAGTARDIVSKLNAVLVKELRSAEIRKRLEADGSELSTSTPEEFARLIRTETAKWMKVIKAAGIKPE